MIVTIPSVTEHAGMHISTYKIADTCPVCGQQRGKIFGTHSYDGSRRLNVDGWKNPCGHVDKYSAVREEGEEVSFKQPTAYGEYAQN